jgi:hypothetical protein
LLVKGGLCSPFLFKVYKMLDINTVIERLDELEGINIQKVIDFIDEMKEARTSLYYNDERRQRFRDLDINEVKNILNTNRGQALRVGIISGKLANLPNTKVIEESLYF